MDHGDLIADAGPTVAPPLSDCSYSSSIAAQEDEASDSAGSSEGSAGPEKVRDGVAVVAGAARSGQISRPDTFFWKGFKFTPVTKDGVHTGLECSCFMKGHFVSGVQRCTRTRAYNRHGGPENTLLLLKTWALRAFTDECVDKAMHAALSDLRPRDIGMSAAELDDFVIPDTALHDEAALAQPDAGTRPKRRRR